VKEERAVVVVVGAVIRDELGKIFCARRALHRSMGGLWEFPGGKVEAGESHQQALARELREELSIEVSVGDLVEETIYAYERIDVHLFTYEVVVRAGAIELKDHDQCVWLGADALEELNWAPADVPTVRKLAMRLT
jgi:8-oxo-dGTP diphosphatase